MADENIDAPVVESTDPVESSGDEGKEPKSAPWTAEDFDAEKAWTLVTNLRAEVADLKAKSGNAETLTQENATAKAQIATLEADLAAERQKVTELSAQVEGITSDRTKEKLLIERGLDSSLLEMLVGDDEAAWTAKADKLAELQGNSKPPVNDFQKNVNAPPTERARLAAAAHNFFNS